MKLAKIPVKEEDPLEIEVAAQEEYHQLHEEAKCVLKTQKRNA